MIESIHCPACDGTGRDYSHRVCLSCKGSGIVERFIDEAELERRKAELKKHKAELERREKERMAEERKASNWLPEYREKQKKYEEKLAEERKAEERKAEERKAEKIKAERKAEERRAEEKKIAAARAEKIVLIILSIIASAIFIVSIVKIYYVN